MWSISTNMCYKCEKELHKKEEPKLNDEQLKKSYEQPSKEFIDFISS